MDINNSSLKLFRLEQRLLASLEVQRSFIVMAIELLQEKKPFANQKEFDEWFDMMIKLQQF